MYHLLSLLLGLVSWGLGIRALLHPRQSWCCLLSLLSCSLSLLLQLVQARGLVLLGDWSALMDTMDAVLSAAFLLVAVTAVLNLIALFRAKA